MRDLIVVLLALVAVVSIASANTDNLCGETHETDGAVLIDMTPCNPDPELGVPSWVAILMDFIPQ